MKKSDNRYLDILKKNEKCLWDAACQMEKNRYEYNCAERVMTQVGGVIIYLFVLWVINEAQSKGIKRLYFLARDGQIFYEVAHIICRENQIDIECKYLYCSRIAWRVPRYFLMKEKCLDYICQRSMNLSIDKMFDRTLLEEFEIESVCEEIGISQADRKRVLNHEETITIKEKFRNSKKFLELVYAKSKMEYERTMGYLNQEGVLENKRFALVDTGWVGSMQESLGDLLTFNKQQQVITEGFYFGMFKVPKNSVQKYYSYFFSPKEGLSRKVIFNNNLLECMCGATEGMTLRYEKKNSVWIPILSNKQNINSDKWNIKENHALVMQYAEYITRIEGIPNITLKHSRKITKELVKTFMMQPSAQEAQVYGAYLFSDDITEKGILELAPKLNQAELFGEDFIPKIFKRIFIKDMNKRQTKSYWIEGSIKRNGTMFGAWHRFNGVLWHGLQYLIYSIKE